MTDARAWVERWLRLPPGLRVLAALGWAAFLWILSARAAAPSRPSVLRALVHNGGHVVVYAILGALVLLALPGAARRGRAVVAWLVSTAYGVLDEVHQSYVPSRTASVGDVLSDAAGALLGIACTLWVWRHDPKAARLGMVAIPIACVCVGAETFLG